MKSPSPSPVLSTPDAQIVGGLGLMMLAMLVAPFIDVFSKLATASTSATMITAARFLFQALFMLPIVLRLKLWRGFSWRLSGFHAIRAAIIAVSMICFVSTLKVMPIADAIAIFFVEPIMLTLLASIFLKETVGWRRYLACAVGFLGAMLIIRPSFAEVGFVALLPVITALCIAIFALMTRALAHKENPWSMQLQMSAWGIPIAAVLLFIGEIADIAIMKPSMPDLVTMTWLIGVGFVAAISGILATYAYRAAPASVIAPLQYMEIVSATLFGWLVFSDFPDATTWLGIAIIIGSGLFIIWRERRFASKPVTATAKTSIAP
ncbi:DMT family transporter [Agrobacterium sp. ES01]|uniref:DMT family transporter n=1 Tax=Agrobacterium sp. ES01 TaxID=3420714 RepID=UPI003D0C823B